MKYTSEINFLKKLLSQFYLNTNLITNEQPLDERIDNGLRKFLGIEEDFKKYIGKAPKEYRNSIGS